MSIVKLLPTFRGRFCFRFQGPGNLGFYLLFNYLPPLNITLYILEDLVLDYRIILKWIFKKWNGKHGLLWYGSGWWQVAGCGDCRNEPLSSIKCGKFLDWKRTCWFLRKDSAPWDWIYYLVFQKIWVLINTSMRISLLANTTLLLFGFTLLLVIPFS
jgi:hypothetical protein